MRWLVTGVNGFVGGHLVARLGETEATLWGIVRPGTPATPGYTPLQADLLDAPAVEGSLAEARPDRIVHLAAQSSAKDSWDDPAGTLRTNLLGLLHLLEAARRQDQRPRVLVVGSSDEYGTPETTEPVGEDTPLRPISPYAVSKVAQSYLALQYTLSHGLPIVRTRTFNHTGPGRGAGFAESSFARQIAEIEAGQREAVIRVGNLDAVRDFSDVRDVARAYTMLVEGGEPGEVYNVASGRGLAVGEILDRLLSLSRARVEVRRDPALLRPADVSRIVGDAGKLRLATGFVPEIPLERTLADLLAYWRERVGAPDRVTS